MPDVSLPPVGGKAHLQDWQSFTTRYGLAHRHDPGRIAGYVPPEWAMRHSEPERGPAVHACICPGVGPGKCSCRQQATHEDFLCDECRQWCVAVDAAGNYHQLATLGGSHAR